MSFKDNVREQIAANIAKARKSKGLSQQDLASAVDVAGASTVSSWERGYNAPDIETLVKICEVLEVPIKKMFGQEEGGGEAPGITISYREQQLILAYRRSPSMQSAVDRILGIDAEVIEAIAPPVAKERWWGDDMTREEFMVASAKRWDDRKNALASFSTSAKAGT